MAGRFVLQQLASGMSRSTSRLVGARASASSRAAAPAMPCASEHGVRTISKLFHAAAAVRPAGSVLPSISNHGAIRCHPTARYLNTLPCLPPRRVHAKIRRLKAKMSPSINNHNKSSELVDSVGQVKSTCSPDASNQLKPVKVPWYNRPVDLNLNFKLDASDVFWFQYTLCSGYLAYALVLAACYEGVNNSSSMVPSQSLHCSCCNCRKRR